MLLPVDNIHSHINENELSYRWRERAWTAMDVFS